MKAFTLSSCSILIRFWIALPLEFFEPSGISKTLIQKHLPFWVKNSIYWWFVPTNKSSRKSSSLVLEAFCPTPPLFWVLYSVRGVLLIYPAWDIVITTFSLGIISSTLKSPPAYSISDLLSSPYFSLISASSSLIKFILFVLLSKRSLYPLIVFCRSSYSSLNLFCSSPVSCLNLISIIALAWVSESLYFFSSFCLASSAFEDFLIRSITSSILSLAMISPSSIWALCSAFFSSKFVLLTTTSCLCSTKWWIKSLRLRSSGLPFTRATLLTLNEDCKGVYL